LNEIQTLQQHPIRIIATRRRRRTVAARLRLGVIEVMVPASMTPAERERWADVMRGRIERQLRRAGPTDERLARRAQTLNERYFAGRLAWSSIRWNDTSSLWGSCTCATGAIRIATRLQKYPEFVLDYVLVHELAHLLHPSHGPAFHEQVSRYPWTERAKGYLMAVGQMATE